MSTNEEQAPGYYGPYFRVRNTGEVGNFVSATGPIGRYEIELLDGSIKAFEYNEIEKITPDEYLAAIPPRKPRIISDPSDLFS